METELKPNEGKKGIITVDGAQYLRLPIRTHLITDEDNICDVAQQYSQSLLQPGDVLFISESGVKTARDVAKLREIGADGVLIGETLMRAADKKAKLNELRGSL